MNIYIRIYIHFKIMKMDQRETELYEGLEGEVGKAKKQRRS